MSVIKTKPALPNFEEKLLPYVDQSPVFQKARLYRSLFRLLANSDILLSPPFFLFFTFLALFPFIFFFCGCLRL
jgi:hypothetical protein